MRGRCRGSGDRLAFSHCVDDLGEDGEDGVQVRLADLAAQLVSPRLLDPSYCAKRGAALRGNPQKLRAAVARVVFVDPSRSSTSRFATRCTLWRGAFNQLQSQAPQTLAHALADSPAWLLGWMGQLLAQGLDDDFVLTNITIHWLCRTAGSSIRFYYEDAKAENPTEPTTVPIGLAGFANDFQSIRRFAERDHKSINQWHTFDVGGHYAAHQVPEVLAGDVREFFTKLS
jgi:pimeloyl-ACP methyl ester carboxylesterase